MIGRRKAYTALGLAVALTVLVTAPVRAAPGTTPNSRAQSTLPWLQKQRTPDTRKKASETPAANKKKKTPAATGAAPVPVRKPSRSAAAPAAPAPAQKPTRVTARATATAPVPPRKPVPPAAAALPLPTAHEADMAGLAKPPVDANPSVPDPAPAPEPPATAEPSAQVDTAKTDSKPEQGVSPQKAHLADDVTTTHAISPASEEQESGPPAKPVEAAAAPPAVTAAETVPAPVGPEIKAVGIPPVPEMPQPETASVETSGKYSDRLPSAEKLAKSQERAPVLETASVADNAVRASRSEERVDRDNGNADKPRSPDDPPAKSQERPPFARKAAAPPAPVIESEPVPAPEPQPRAEQSHEVQPQEEQSQEMPVGSAKPVIDAAAVETDEQVASVSTDAPAETAAVQVPLRRTARLVPNPDRKPQTRAAKKTGQRAAAAAKTESGANSDVKKPPQKDPKKMTRLQKCQALLRCRAVYTRCDDGIRAKMKPGPARDKARDQCVLDYQKCHKPIFEGGEMLFTRWFWNGSKCS